MGLESGFFIGIHWLNLTSPKLRRNTAQCNYPSLIPGFLFPEQYTGLMRRQSSFSNGSNQLLSRGLFATLCHNIEARWKAALYGNLPSVKNKNTITQ